jgi:hypothetical protein
MRFVIGAVAASVLFFTIFPVFGEMPAKPYHPVQPITVVSECVVSGGMSTGADGIFWNVMPETRQDGSFCLGFYRAETGHPVCRLVPDGANPGLYLADGARFSNAISLGGLMVFPGFSVPCDILPVIAACGGADPEIIEIRRQAGESAFVEQFQLDCIAVTPGEALAEGWLREPVDGMEPLVLIRATSLRNGEYMARQLWVSGDAWWLYEETPYRRSWRLR